MSFLEIFSNIFSRFRGFLFGSTREPLFLPPKTIEIIEEYNFQTSLLGIESNTQSHPPSGCIEFHIPYDTDQNQLAVRSADSLWQHLTSAEHGHLKINEYGRTDLNSQVEVDIDANTLPIQSELAFEELELIVRDDIRHSTLQLKHDYSPQELQFYPMFVDLKIIDEDYDEDDSENHVQSSESISETLLRQIKEQSGLKHTLSIRCFVILYLSNHFSTQYDIDNAPTLTQVTLNWPISTPHQATTIKIDNNPNSPQLNESHKNSHNWALKSFTYDPEAGHIQIENLPMYFNPDNEENHYLVYDTWLQIEIDDPAEFYNLDELEGSITVKLGGLFSGLTVAYENGIDTASNEVAINCSTVIENTIEIRLADVLSQKTFRPRQYLSFPGVILNEARIADIMMLLQEKGFSPEEPIDMDSQNSEKAKYDRKYKIKAARKEGARVFNLTLDIQGEKLATMRERGIEGDAKYISPLGAGNTTVYIFGELEGDSKRVTQVVNEIQLQLKEQFRHVGTTV